MQILCHAGISEVFVRFRRFRRYVGGFFVCAARLPVTPVTTVCNAGYGGRLQKTQTEN